AIDDLADDSLECLFLDRGAGRRRRTAQVNRLQRPISRKEIDSRADLGACARIEIGNLAAMAPLASVEIAEAREQRREGVSLVPQARDGNPAGHRLYNAALRARSSVG